MLTDIQFARALALAAAYGHEWAQVVHAGSDLRDPDDIRAAVLAAHPDRSLPGIEAPAIEGTLVRHRTGSGSGRLEWAVEPDGTVTLTVHRPPGIADGSVLMAGVGPEGSVGAWATGAGPWAVRHVDALRDALYCVAAPAEVDRALALLPEPPEPDGLRDELRAKAAALAAAQDPRAWS